MPVPGRPLPRITSINAPFWEGARAGRLRLQRCSHCCEVVYIPRVACPNCLQTTGLEWIDASGRGTVYSFAFVHRPQHPAFFAEVPITLVAVQLKEGPIVISSLIDCPQSALRIGLPVQVVFREVDGLALPKFAPAAAGE